MDLFELNRKVDRLLFDALPDKPEASFERHINGQVSNRETMNALDSNQGSILNASNSITIGTSTYDPVKKQFRYSKIKTKDKL